MFLMWTGWATAREDWFCRLSPPNAESKRVPAKAGTLDYKSHRTEHGPSGRIAMNTRATILAALMGSTILAGAALAAGDMSLVNAAKEGDRAAVQTVLKGLTKQDVASAEGTAALVWAATRNDLAMADLLLHACANTKAANEFGAPALYAAAEHVEPAMAT